MAIAPGSINSEYASLKRIVKEQGLLEPQRAYYWLKTIVTMAMLAGGFAVAVLASNPLVIVLDAIFVGFASTQLALLAHDVGHRQGFRGRRTNRVARTVFANLLLGLSHSWWVVKHNQHHATPNHIDKDPDIQFSILAFAPEQIRSRARWAKPIIAAQAFVLPILLPFQAINMRLSSVRHLAVERSAVQPWVQGALILVHFAVYGALLYSIGSWGLALTFALVHQGVFGLYNSSVFASNHKGMPVLDNEVPTDFLREQVLTARNVTGHVLTDFWYGGLNYQIEHHLFPTMPRKNLRAAQVVVERFCRENGIAYESTGLFRSYRDILVHMHRTSASLRGGAKVAA